MADRIPLIVDVDDGNKLKELPIGDNLNLTGSGIVGAGNIAATSLTIAGVPYNPFSGQYADLIGTPTIPSTTDDIVEGTKKYLTDERVDDRIANFLVAGLGINLTYNDSANTLTIEATGVGSGGGGGGATALDGLTDVTLTNPSNNQLLKYNGTIWVNSTIAYTELTGRPTFANVATSGSYNDLSNKPSIPNDISDMVDVDTQSTPPQTGQVLKWDGIKWAPADDITSGGSGLNADTLDGFDSTYFLDWNNVTNKPTYALSDLNDISLSSSVSGQVLYYDGISWINSTNQPDFSNILNKPTTIAGYGITDSPEVLTDIGISDGSANEFLTTDGAGSFTFTDTLSGGVLTATSSLNFAGSPVTVNNIDNDSTFTANSGTRLVTQSAIKAYVDSAVVPQNLFETFNAETGFTTADSAVDEFNFVGSGGISTTIVGDTLTITNTAPNVDQNIFNLINITGGVQDSINANTQTTAINFTAGTGIAITSNNITKEITFTATGGGGGGTPGGADTQVQFNNAGSFGGDADFVYNSTTNTLTVVNLVTSSISPPATLTGTYTISSPTTITLDPVDEIINDAPMKLVSKTVTDLSTLVSSVGAMVFCTDESGGAIPAFYDGTNWRRVSDRAIVS
jgi:hypothetical protein